MIDCPCVLIELSRIEIIIAEAQKRLEDGINRTK